MPLTGSGHICSPYGRRVEDNSVDRMINRGAQLTPQEEQTLIDYLAKNYN